MSFDPNGARARFPGLVTDWVLFDNAGGSQILDSAMDRVREAFLTSHVQPGGTYAASQKVSERVDAATREWAACWNAADPRELVFGASTTQLFQNLSRAIEPTIQPGDGIIVCEVDHEANIGPWVRLASRGAEIRWWRPNRETFELSLDDLSRLLTKRTRLVSFSHVSNVLGHINPAREIVRLAHDAGAQVVIDGVSYAPHRRVDVRAIGADFYAASVYKVYGPHQSILYGRLDRLEALPPINHYFIPADKLPHKLAPGGYNFELVHGAGAVPQYLASLGPRGLDEVADHETALAERVLSFLRSRKGVRIIGLPKGAPDRVPTISFVVEGRDPTEIVPKVDAHRVGIKAGDFYARRLCDALGLTKPDSSSVGAGTLAQGGVVRASLVHYNTLAEADRLCAVLDQVIS
ncbi:MAG: aminotransferase class V-fold PLP-dependent enzyme [Myxococcales bacterium]|nr:aminotransferase class V-fold PLP-dependent enzyme [Myxococcales bacterium]